MKSNSITGRLLGLFLPLALAGSVYAGAGFQYWQALKASPAIPPTAASSQAAIVKLCTNMTVVPIIVLTPSAPNGRGPLQAVQIGTKVVCTSCEMNAIVQKVIAPNGRGPLQAVAVATGLHDCSAGCSAMPHA